VDARNIACKGKLTDATADACTVYVKKLFERWMIDVHYYVAYLVCISGGWWWNFSACRFCGELHGRVALLSATSMIMK
jgi:hypothetical protein